MTIDCVDYDYIYEPREDSYLLLNFIRENKQLFYRKKILDVGTGSGILAREASRYSDDVLAVDINRRAVNKLKGGKFSVKCSDLFSKVKSKFDIILFNPPYLPKDDGEPGEVSLALCGGSHGYEIIERFLKGLNGHLKNEGFALLVFSSLTDRSMVDNLIYKYGFSFDLIDAKRFDFETLFLYKIVKQDFLKDEAVTFLKYLSQGKRSFVYLVEYNHKKAVVKVKKPSTIPNVVSDECFWLSIVNKFSIGPNLLKCSKTYLIMNFVDGETFYDFIKHANQKSIKFVLKSVAEQMIILDSAGIVKEEMNHPKKHIIVSDKEPVLIDFERSHFSNKPKNFTQFIQFLTSKSVANILSIKFSFDKAKLRALASAYKKEVSVVDYKNKDFVMKTYKKLSSFVDKLLNSFSEKSFYEQVYSLTALIPKGKVLTYGLVAYYLGSKAFRAVGSALHKNPYKEVPCHRVVNSNGFVGGFARGRKKKIFLLKLEGIAIENGRIKDLEKFLFKL